MERSWFGGAKLKKLTMQMNENRYGSHFFYSLKVQCVPDLLSNLPNNLLLAFNADGMHIFSVDKKELLQQYSYADVHSWRGTRRQVWCMVHSFELRHVTQRKKLMWGGIYC